jgi:hypothetical protein
MAQVMHLKWFREWGAYFALLEEEKVARHRQFLESCGPAAEDSCICGEFGCRGPYVDPEGWRRCSHCGGRFERAYWVPARPRKAGTRLLYLGWLHQWLPFVRQEMRRQGLDGMGDIGPARDGSCIHGSTGEFGWYVDEDSRCRCRLCGGEM